MNIVIIVNIIAALAILTGGLMMRKYADEPVDRSIGFRTKKVCQTARLGGSPIKNAAEHGRSSEQYALS
jgi:hypothetical protein